MWNDSENLIVWLALLVQLIGIGGVFAARLHSTKVGSRRSDLLALLCFGVVGILSLCLMRVCSATWLSFAVTMPLMAVGATLDAKVEARDSRLEV